MTETTKRALLGLATIVVVMALVGAALGYYAQRLGFTQPVKAGVSSGVLALLIGSLGIWLRAGRRPTS